MLTAPDRRHGGWQTDLDEFYATGRAAVDECLALAEPSEHHRALDFGCGTGRLSFALAGQFDDVTAVDVSPGMLATLSARALDAGITNVRPVPADALSDQHAHDFALSLLVLQHLPGRAAIDAAIGAIAGALAPGAPAVIELPARATTVRARLQPRLRAYQVLRAVGCSPARLHGAGLSGISMCTVSPTAATRMFTRHGMSIVGQVLRPDRGYDYVRWVVRRAG